MNELLGTISFDNFNKEVVDNIDLFTELVDEWISKYIKWPTDEGKYIRDKIGEQLNDDGAVAIDGWTFKWGNHTYRVSVELNNYAELVLSLYEVEIVHSLVETEENPFDHV